METIIDRAVVIKFKLIFKQENDLKIKKFVQNLNNKAKTVDQSGQTKDYKIDICYFSAKHTPLRSKNKVWFRIMCPIGATCLPANCCFTPLK